MVCFLYVLCLLKEQRVLNNVRQPLFVEFDAELVVKNLLIRDLRLHRFQSKQQVVDHGDWTVRVALGRLDGDELVEEQHLSLVLEVGDALQINSDHQLDLICEAALQSEQQPVAVSKSVGDILGHCGAEWSVVRR